MTRVADGEMDRILGKLARQQKDIFGRVHGRSLSPEKVFHCHRQLINGLKLEKSFVVSQNPNRNWAEAIANKIYMDVDINRYFTLEDLPPYTGIPVPEANLYSQENDLRPKDWHDLFNGNKLSCEKFAHPLTVLSISGEALSGLEKPIFTLWESPKTGSYWFLLLVDRNKARFIKTDYDYLRLCVGCVGDCTIKFESSYCAITVYKS